VGETIGKNQHRVGWWGRPCFGRITNTEESPKLKLDMHSDLNNYFDSEKPGQKLHWHLDSSALSCVIRGGKDIFQWLLIAIEETVIGNKPG